MKSGLLAIAECTEYPEKGYCFVPASAGNQKDFNPACSASSAREDTRTKRFFFEMLPIVFKHPPAAIASLPVLWSGCKFCPIKSCFFMQFLSAIFLGSVLNYPIQYFFILFLVETYN